LIVGAIVSGSLVYVRFGVLISRSTLIKGTAAAAVLVPPALVLSADGLWLVPKYAVIAFVYAGLLWVLGELRREDLQPILSWH
jgi:stage V sporulation protein B